MQGLSRARGPFGRLGSTSNKLKVIIKLFFKYRIRITYGLTDIDSLLSLRCLRVRAVENLCRVALFA